MGENNIPDIHYNLDYALKRLGMFEDAIHAFNNAIAEYREELNRNPRSSAIHAALGSAYVESKNFKKASEHFQQTVIIDPAGYTNHYNLIKSLEVQGRLDEAIESARKAGRFMLDSGQNEAAIKFQQYLKSLKSKKIEWKY